MSRSRDRKEAAKNLGIVMSAQYRKMLAAVGQEEVTQAATELGVTFNNNIEFIAWVLKEYGGMEQMPIQPRSKSQ